MPIVRLSRPQSCHRDVTGSARDYGDASLVCGANDGGSIEEQRTSSLQSEAGCASSLQRLNGANTDDGDVEAHVLVRLGDLHYGESATQSRGRVAEAMHQCTGALNRHVGPFHGYEGDARLGSDDAGLAQVVAGDGA